MSEVADGDAALPPYFEESVEAVHRAVRRYGGVLLGLWQLRQLGEIASDAVDAVLEVPTIKQLRVSWDLLLLLATDIADDTGQLFAKSIGGNEFTLVTGAFYGWEGGAPSDAFNDMHTRGPVAVDSTRCARREPGRRPQ